MGRKLASTIPAFLGVILAGRRAGECGGCVPLAARAGIGGSVWHGGVDSLGFRMVTDSLPPVLPVDVSQMIIDVPVAEFLVLSILKRFRELAGTASAPVTLGRALRRRL